MPRSGHQQWADRILSTACSYHYKRHAFFAKARGFIIQENLRPRCGVHAVARQRPAAPAPTDRHSGGDLQLSRLDAGQPAVPQQTANGD